MQAKANAQAAELLAKKKRKAKDVVEQANAAMREAKRLQAEANAKIRRSRGRFKPFRPSRRTTPADAAPKGAEALQQASSGYERIPIERES